MYSIGKVLVGPSLSCLRVMPSDPIAGIFVTSAVHVVNKMKSNCAVFQLLLPIPHY